MFSPANKFESMDTALVTSIPWFCVLIWASVHFHDGSLFVGTTCRTRTIILRTCSRQLRCRSSGCSGSGALRKGRGVELHILALLTANVEVLGHGHVVRATSQEGWGSGRPGLICPQRLGRRRPRSLWDLKQDMYALSYTDIVNSVNEPNQMCNLSNTQLKYS